MEKGKDLTQGPILWSLVKLALPIMATSMVMMSYNLMDLFWLGRLPENTRAATAAGTVGIFLWMANSLALIPKVGAEIGVALSAGQKNNQRLVRYLYHAGILAVFLAFVFSGSLYFFRHPVVGFFRLNDPLAIDLTHRYLIGVLPGMLFTFLNPVFSGLYIGLGRTTLPFWVNSWGLILNMLLDPYFIFYFRGGLGILGAALATVLSQAAVTFLFFLILKKDGFLKKTDRKRLDPAIIQSIFHVGSPVALEAGFFALVYMGMGRIIAHWGYEALAIQKIGSQLESITWMTIEGFSTGIGAFIAQNRGAKNEARVREGFRQSLLLVASIGTVTGCILFFGAEPLFRLFIPNRPEVLKEGVTYLHILALSEVFVATEIGSLGAFSGLGKTKIPAAVGMIMNGLRLPLAFLAVKFSWPLFSIWWIITLLTVGKGVLNPLFFQYTMNREFDSWQKVSNPSN